MNIENEDLPLRNYKTILTEESNHYENPSKKYEKPNLNRFLKNDSFYPPQFNLSGAYTPRRNFQRKNIRRNANLNRHINLNKTFDHNANRNADLYGNDRSPINRKIIHNYSRLNIYPASKYFNTIERNNGYKKRKD